MQVKTSYKKIYVELEEFLKNTNKELIIIVPFITVNALSILLKNIKPNTKIIIVTRWRLVDLIMGVSDINVFNYLKSFNATLYFKNDIHLKVFIKDKKEMIIGSANLTMPGIGVAKKSNIEAIVNLDASSKDIVEIFNIIRESTEVTEEIYLTFKKEAEKYKSLKGQLSNITEKFKIFEDSIKKENKLLVFDFPFTESPEILYKKMKTGDILLPEIAHDILLFKLKIDSEILLEDIKNNFLLSNVYSWQLKKMNGEILFGEYSQLLHNTLIDDPAPYRKDVKKLVLNMFIWTSQLSEEYIIIKHNHTSSMRKVIN
jgi:hypothetical protein